MHDTTVRHALTPRVYPRRGSIPKLPHSRTLLLGIFGSTDCDPAMGSERANADAE